MPNANEYLMVGCDLHEKSVFTLAARGQHPPVKRTFTGSATGRAKMIQYLQELAHQVQAQHIVFAYEAGPLGFGLYDELTAAGIRCHVLAPSRMAKSDKDRKDKTDEKDAGRILQHLRNHLLAGQKLPEVWIPDRQTRHDRQLVRHRQSLAEQATRIKTQITTLLKANAVDKPPRLGKNWTQAHRQWLDTLATKADSGLAPSLRVCLQSMLRMLRHVEKELDRLAAHLTRLADSARYRGPAQALLGFKGVGLVTTMVFLTELGHMSRFANRRQLAAYLGLVPSCAESGQRTDRKGHITRQGSARVRRALCQAAWVWCRFNPNEQARLIQISRAKKDRKKIALVAQMRRLAIRLWHKAREAQQANGCFPSARESGHGLQVH